jgi:hypothetical protein
VTAPGRLQLELDECQAQRVTQFLDAFPKSAFAEILGILEGKK